MAYFIIGEYDYSPCVSELKINTTHNYNAQTNAAGDTVIDYINTKRQIEVTIIALDEGRVAGLLQAIAPAVVDIGFRNPATLEVETIQAFIPQTHVEYYTIQVNKKMCKAFTLTFTEL